MVNVASNFKKLINSKDYPYLNLYTHPVKQAKREIIGREKEMREIMAAFERPELSNVILLANGGGGKTALVQGLMLKDKKRYYLEVQLSRMIADAKNHPDSIAEWLRSMFSEAADFGKTQHHEIVLFIDEFHQIVQISPAAVEVMKPLLADSGTRGIRVIAATTYDEWRKYISSNQPLVERLQRIQLPQPGKEVIVSILRNMAKIYHVDQYFPNDNLFDLIYEYTNRYIPSQIQPRKSILVLDAMIGYHRALKKDINKDLLGQVLYDQQGINIAFTADATKIEDTLNAHVISQDIAASAIAHRLQICIADLNDKTKPMSSMLFTGPTGVGKTETVKQLAKLLFNDTQQLIRFDMTEYSEDNSVDRFRIELTNRVWAHPYCILLLDEIEKASSAVTRLLLQVLDDGRLSDQNNRTVSFVNTYVVMTSNAASEIYKIIGEYQSGKESPRMFMQRHESEIRDSIQNTTGNNKFPPELLGRIDTIVPFRPLSHDTYIMIAKIKLNSLLKNVALKHNTHCIVDERVITYLVDNEVDVYNSDAGGARALVHKIETDVTTNVAEFVNSFPQYHNIYITVHGKMASEDKKQFINRSYIEVKRIQ